MTKAVWENAVLAESDQCIIVEGHCYFPPDAVHWEFLERVPQQTVCGWKGTASYCDVVVAGKRNPAAAWFYPDPQPAASEIKGHLAFWRGVEIVP